MVRLDPDALDQASKRREREWARYDDVLYRMCQDFPGHRDAASVNAKVGIIARAYATGIERKIRSRRTQGSSLLQLTEFIAKHGAQVDAALAPLRRLTEPLKAEKLKLIVEKHGALVEMLKPLLRDRQASRSFWSKYLHFHCPLVPIYDSYVAGALPSIIRWNRALEVFHPEGPVDDVYCWYAMRFLALYQIVRKGRPRYTVKELDFYLLGL